MPSGRRCDSLRRADSGCARPRAPAGRRSSRLEAEQRHGDGTGAKLLDFGLARGQPWRRVPTVHEFAGSEQADGRRDDPRNVSLHGPEQLEGKEADARTDIFTFGTVVYKMATGRRAFQGQSQASLIAAILERNPPPPSTEQARLSPRSITSCGNVSAKDPNERWQSARDLMFELRWIAERTSEADSAQAPQKSRERLAWSAAGLALLIAVGVVIAAASRRSAGPSQAGDGHRCGSTLSCRRARLWRSKI